MPIREVSNPERTSYPYSTVGIIFTTWQDGTVTSGTATVVGVNDILTAGHVVFNPDKGGWGKDFDFYFGADYNSVTDRFDSYQFSYSLTSGFGWKGITWSDQIYTDSSNSTNTSSEAQYDVAIIGLSVRVGDITGWMGLSWDYNYSQVLNQVGYPSDGTGMMAGKVFVTRDYYYNLYHATTDGMGPGSSGGPLFTDDSYVVGVKSTGDGSSSTWADFGFLSVQIRDFLTSNDSLISQVTDDYSASIYTLGKIAVGGHVRGNIELEGDRDWFSVFLVSGRSYKFSLTGTSNGLADPMLKFYSPSGVFISSDDDSGLGLDAEILYTATSTGTYFLESLRSTSSAALGLATGSYDLAVSETLSSYLITSNAKNVDEGSNAIFTVTASNLIAGSVLSYQISGVSASDILGGKLNGTAVVGLNSKATISIPIAADKVTEGSETLIVSISNVSASVIINDTSFYKGPTSVNRVYVFRSEKIGENVDKASFSYFYSDNENEAININSQPTWPWVQKSSSFESAHSNPDLAIPLFRFWSDNLRSHFFTVSEVERDQIILWSSTGQNGYDWRYEGKGFGVYNSAFPTDDLGNNAIPVHRLWMDDKDFDPTNGNSGGHYFTANNEEYEQMLKLVGVRDEGIAFYGEPLG